MLFYLEGVASVAAQATETASELMRLFDEHQKKILEKGGKGAQSALRVYELAKKKAVLSIPEAAKTLALTHPTVSSAVKLLEQLGILSEMTGKQRDRQYLYSKYVTILSDGPHAR